jgi:phage-related minor tail protein
MVDAIKNGTLNLEEFGKIGEQNANLVGDTFEKQKDPIDQMTIAQNQLKSVMADLGNEIATTLAPILEVLGKVLGTISGIFKSLPGPVKQFIIIFGGLIAAVTTIAPIIAGIVTLLATGLLPVIGTTIGIIAAVAAAIIGVIAVFKNWSQIIEWIQNILSKFADFMSGIWDGIKNIAVKAWDGIKKAVTLKIVVWFKSVE